MLAHARGEAERPAIATRIGLDMLDLMGCGQDEEC